MTAKGGRRIGAGRKPKAFNRVIHETQIQKAESKIMDKLPWLVDKMLELVEGVEVQMVDRRGHERVYTQPPDRQAAEYLIDRVMGKPVQPISLVDKVREMAAAHGYTDEETEAAVAEATRLTKAPKRASS